MLNRDLSILPLFRGLSPAQIDRLAPLVESCLCPISSVIFRQGDPAEYLYILRTGEVEVLYQTYDGPAITVAHVREGGVFGWSAALGHAAYTSSAVCMRVSEVLRIKGQALHDLCSQAPETGVVLLERLAGVIAERLTNTHSHVVHILADEIHAGSECQRRLDEHERR